MDENIFKQFVEAGHIDVAMSMIGDLIDETDVRRLMGVIHGIAEYRGEHDEVICAIHSALLRRFWQVGCRAAGRFYFSAPDERRTPGDIMDRFGSWIKELACLTTSDTEDVWYPLNVFRQECVHEAQLIQLHQLAFTGALPMHEMQPERMNEVEAELWMEKNRKIAGPICILLTDLEDRAKVTPRFLRQCGLDGMVLRHFKEMGVMDDCIDKILRKMEGVT